VKSSGSTSNGASSNGGDAGAGEGRRVRGPNDPHRRERIIEAAMRVISRSGVEALTHRAIAKEAGVPLGSTTYYFKTLDDIIVAALEQAIHDDTDKLERWAEGIQGPDDVANALTRRIMEDSADLEREVVWYRLFLWGATDPATQEISYRWSQLMTKILERFVDDQLAEVLSTLYDALLLRVMTSGGRIEEKDVARIIDSVVNAHLERR
jgi:TetR/AcrR family transcriptional regulator, regulator of biofilm formation and stress response